MKTLSALLLLCATAAAQDTLNVAVIKENVSPPLYSWIDLLEDEGCDQDVTKVSGASEGNYISNNWPTIIANNPDVVLIAFGKGPGTLANLEDRLEDNDRGCKGRRHFSGIGDSEARGTGVRRHYGQRPRRQRRRVRGCQGRRHCPERTSD